MRQKFAYASSLALSAPLCLLFSASAAFAQTTSFTYQGRLSDGSTPASGSYDMKFRLYDSGGNPQGSPDTLTFDSPDIESQLHPTVTNSFNVRAVNGSFFYTNTASRLTA